MQKKYFNNKLNKFKTIEFKLIKIKNIQFFLKINPKNGFIDKEIFTKGIYESDIYELMLKIIKKGDTCVDIGANIGMYTNFFPKIVGSQGRIIGFEPIKNIYLQNLSSIKKNNYKNVTLINSACGNINKIDKIYLNESNIGGSSILNKSKKYEPINILIGDDILIKEKNINFIKIDTEGYEWEVLKGIKNTIKQKRPGIIIEFSPQLYNNGEGKKILSYLKDNYKLVYIIENDQYLNLEISKDLIIYNKLSDKEQVNLYYYK